MFRHGQDHQLTKFKPSIRTGKKGDLSHSEHGAVVGARLAAISKNADLLGFSKIIISMVHRERSKKRKHPVNGSSVGENPIVDASCQRVLQIENSIHPFSSQF